VKSQLLPSVLFTTFLSLLISPFNIAQAQGVGQDAEKGTSMIGLFTGRILPKNIDGADEIFSLSGVRYSLPLSKTGFVDGGAIFGNGEGVKWQGAFLGLSMLIPVETLIGHAGLGLDMTRYETTTTESKNIGGAHFIGGIMAKIGGNCLARFDMKMNSKPGSSLYFAIGLTFELGESEQK
jgi:hypothetical protein